MAISAKLLGEDEYVVASTRTHWKFLIVPVLVLILVAGGGGVLVTIIPAGGLQGPLRILIGAVALVAFAIWVLKPFLGWYFSTYTLTNRRMITRHGVLNRTGRDIPLMRINDVSYEHHLIDRLLGCGTLVIESASERGQVTLPDVPHVERLHLQMADLLFGGPDGQRGDGILEDEQPRQEQRPRGNDASTLFSSEEDKP